MAKKKLQVYLNPNIDINALIKAKYGSMKQLQTQPNNHITPMMLTNLKKQKSITVNTGILIALTLQIPFNKLFHLQYGEQQLGLDVNDATHDLKLAQAQYDPDNPKKLDALHVRIDPLQKAVIEQHAKQAGYKNTANYLKDRLNILRGRDVYQSMAQTKNPHKPTFVLKHQLLVKDNEQSDNKKVAMFL